MVNNVNMLHIIHSAAGMHIDTEGEVDLNKNKQKQKRNIETEKKERNQMYVNELINCNVCFLF